MFPQMFERLAIDVMLECSIYGASEFVRISWDEADGIERRAVHRGLKRKGEQSYQRKDRGQDYVAAVYPVHERPCSGG